MDTQSSFTPSTEPEPMFPRSAFQQLEESFTNRLHAMSQQVEAAQAAMRAATHEITAAQQQPHRHARTMNTSVMKEALHNISPYDGKRQNDAAMVWLRKVELQYRWLEALTRPLTDLEKIAQTMLRLDGEAGKWAMKVNDENTIVTWDEWKIQFRAQFQDPTSNLQRWTAWEKLHQTKTVASFASKLRSDAVYLDPRPTDFELLRRFKAGLAGSIRYRIFQQPLQNLPDTFEGFQAYAIQQEQELDYVAKSMDPSSRQRKNKGTVPKSASESKLDEDGDWKMELNAIQSGLTDAERTKRKEENLCYNCAEPGHKVRNCPTRVQPEKKQKGKGKSSSKRGKGKAQ